MATLAAQTVQTSLRATIAANRQLAPPYGPSADSVYLVEAAETVLSPTSVEVVGWWCSLTAAYPDSLREGRTPEEEAAALRAEGAAWDSQSGYHYPVGGACNYGTYMAVLEEDKIVRGQYSSLGDETGGWSWSL